MMIRIMKKTGLAHMNDRMPPMIPEAEPMPVSMLPDEEPPVVAMLLEVTAPAFMYESGKLTAVSNCWLFDR